MPYVFDHFGKRASFDDYQAIVVQALVADYLQLFSRNVQLEIDKEQLEETLRVRSEELKELQSVVDATVLKIDPDSE